MGPKRKRTVDSNGAGGRPSPHRPADTNLGSHDRGRSGNGGRSTRRNEPRDPVPSSSSAGGAGTPLTSPTAPRPSSSSSRPAVAPLNTAVPAVPSPNLSPIQSGYHYDVITDTRLGRWAQGGRQELVDHGIQSRDDEDVQELATIFQELLQSCLDLRLKASQAGDVAKEIIGLRPADAETNARTFDPHTLFLDTVSVYLDVETGNDKANLRDFMISTAIDAELMRRVLEPSVLQQLGLIRDSFTKMGIRQATNILYKQANYNLLREETEGYAKLATELFTTCNSQAPSSEAIEAAFERVKGLIGTFDLDVGRVLDVLLDVFASVLIKQNRFFVKLLRISSWWPRSQSKSSAFAGGLPKWALPESKHWQTSEEDEEILSAQRLQRDLVFWDRAREVHLNAFFELGGRQLQASDLQNLQALLDSNGGSLDDVSHLDAETQWIVTTKTLPPQGNRVAAQLLGFKFRFYASSFRDKNVDIIPANLYYMTALLIKIGFISLADLWPHLSPDDDKMQEHRAKREKILAEEERKKTGRTENALTMAVLTNDVPDDPKARTKVEGKSSEGTKDDDEDDEQARFPPQKVQLLTELLTIGAIPEALYILARYPWLLQAYPDLITLINRLLAHSIQKVFEQTRESTEQTTESARLDVPSRRLPDVDQTGVTKGYVNLGQTQQRRPLRWPHPDGEKDNSPYRFYWEDWADNTPICQTVDDVFTLCNTLLNLSGVNIGRDAALLAKLASIGSVSLAQDQSPQNKDRWLDLLSRLLVPALSLTEANCFVVHAVWDLLQLYPTITRYSIYSDWYLGRTSRNYWITSAFARTKAETNSALKRLSLTNLSIMAKKLAKTAYSSPGTVFKTAFDQIEAYPNLIHAFVECARYFPALGYDVLNWSLMSALSGKSRSRTQEASVLLTSKWLQALSKFSGRVFKRYSNMQPSAVLQYVNSQLLRGSSTDLVILRELILSMAGVVSDIDFTDAQLWAMTGGETLRKQTLLKLGDRRFESVNGSKRLMQSLIDTKLAGRLLINLAQYRQAALYRDDAHVKYLGTILDEVHQALTQYLDLLRTNLSPEQFDRAVPSITDLISIYGLDVSLAFMIGRASLAYRMANTKAIVLSPVKDGRANAQLAPEVIDIDGDSDMNGTSDPVNTAKGENEDKMALDDKAAENAVDASATPATETRMPDPIADVIQPLVDTIQDLLPSETWEVISPEFYVTFWSLSLGDLNVPQTSYNAEHESVNKELSSLMRDRSDMSRQGVNKKEEKKQALQKLSNSVRDEMSAHINRYQKTKFRLTRQAKAWFTGTNTGATLVADALLEHCVFPRIFMSAPDTEYCVKLVKFLHENQTPNFKLFAFYEQLFNANRLRAIMFSATVQEAEHLGRFIKSILEDLSRWHNSKSIYEKEAFGPSRKHLGFATAFDEEGNPTAFIEHPYFRDAHFEWHKNLNLALKACLTGTKEWMHIRNALTIVKWIHEFFPAVNFMGTQMLKALDDIKKREESSSKDESEEHRVDLSVAALTVYAMVKRRESKMVSVQAFRPNMVSTSPQPKHSKAAINTTQSGMAQDGSKDVEMTVPTVNNILRPTAPEFKPKAPATSVPSATPIKQATDPKILTQASTTTSAQPAEEEDGEVKDGKDAKNAANSAQAAQAKTDPRAGRLVAPDRSAPKELTNREKTTSQNERPATQKPSPAAASTSGTRGDNSRLSSGISRLGGLPHGLPSRPDVPIPGHFRGQPGIPERPPAPSRDSGPTRDNKDIREPRRDPREIAREPREPPKDPARLDRRDPHDSDRRNIETTPRESGRLSERDSSNRSESSARRIEPPSERDARSNRDRGQPPVRESRSLREQATPSSQPQPTATKSAPQEPPINPQRAALWQTDGKPEAVNPSRSVSSQDSRGAPSARSTRDSGRERGSSRTSSPRREDRPNGNFPTEDYREDRHGRRNGNVPEPLPPQLPRGVDHSRDSGRPLTERTREASFQGPPSTSREPGRSRASQQDPTYGRLSATVTDQAPQVPRGRGARNPQPRISSLPAGPRSDSHMPPPDLPRAPSPTRQPPTEPSSARGRRVQSSQHEQSQISGVSPTVPTSSLGMHPDRIRQFETQGQAAPSPPPPPPGGPANRARPSVAPIHTNDRMQAPTGPSNTRHGQGQGSLPNTPIRESNAPHSAPTGPAASQDRHNKSGARRQLSAIQNSIAPSRREDGRRQRASLPDSDAQVLTGASPISTPVHERVDPMRRNPMPDFPPAGGENSAPRSREASRSGAQPEDFSTMRGSESDRSGRREHRDRAEKSSRHGTRERSPRGEREARDLRGSEIHERHDRRPGPPPGVDLSRDRDPNHEPIQPRRSNRDLMAASNARELLPGVDGREPPMSGGRDPRHRGDGRGDNGRGGSARMDNGRLDGAGGGRLGGDEWGGGGRGGSMRGAPPRDGPREGPRDGGSGRLGGDDRRDSRGDDRPSRKRRSDVADMPPHERDKRLRR